MMPQNERLLELMAQRATEGLAASEAREFDRLAVSEPGADVDGLDYAAAAIQLAFLDVQPMPAEIAQRVRSTASARETAPSPVPSRPTPLISLGGWIAAAALLAVTVILWPRSETTESPFDETRALHLPWTPVDAAGKFGRVTGEVVWDEATQRGYMRFRGLPVNDPAREQYQLWIVDGRDGRYKHPVDGGVFDCAAESECRVPIDAKLPVRDATTFVLTAEQPGGVVVSDGPFLVLAKR
jgi:anti-sigma-K factor RskA